MKKIIAVILIIAALFTFTAAAFAEEAKPYSGWGIGSTFYPFLAFPSREGVEYVAFIGEYVEVAGRLFGTRQALVVGQDIGVIPEKECCEYGWHDPEKYYDIYIVRVLETGELLVINRNEIEK